MTEHHRLQTNCIPNGAEHPQDSSSTFLMPHAVTRNSYAHGVSESQVLILSQIDGWSRASMSLSTSGHSQPFHTENVPSVFLYSYVSKPHVNHCHIL